MQSTRIALVATVAAAAFAVVGCGGSTSTGNKAGGAGGEVYIGNYNGLFAPQLPSLMWPALGKNTAIDSDGNPGTSPSLPASPPYSASMYFYANNSQIWARNSVNRFRRRVNVQGANLTEPLQVAAAMHTAYLVTKPGYPNSQFETVDNQPTSAPDTTSTFFTFAGPADRTQEAIKSYNLYNEALDTLAVTGVNGTVFSSPSTFVINPDFTVNKYAQVLHPDSYGNLETHGYPIPGTLLDPGFAEYYWPEPCPFPYFCYRAGFVDITVQETWNLIYGRLPMMRHSYTQMGYCGRVNLCGETQQFDTTLGGILDTPFGVFPFWRIMYVDGSAGLSGVPSMMQGFAPKIFGNQADIDAATNKITPLVNSGLPNRVVMTFASEVGIPRLNWSVWPTNRETGVWRGYNPRWDVALPPGIPDRNPATDPPYGIPIHAILPTGKAWTNLSITFSTASIDPVTGVYVAGSGLNTLVLFGGGGSLGSSSLTADANLEAGEFFIVPRDYLHQGETYMVQAKATTTTEIFDLKWTFRCAAGFNYSDAATGNSYIGYDGNYPNLP